jgi:protein SCO1/2
MYSSRFPDPSAARGIHFLTGAPNDVSKVADSVGFPFRLDQQSSQYAHPAGFVVVTPGGRISRYVLGLNPPAAALKEAVAEAGRGTVTPAAHPLLLLCFGYDPDASTAAALAMRLVRYVYMAALLACALIIAGFWLRRRAA